MWELTFSKIPDSFSSRSDFFYTLKCEEPDYIKWRMRDDVAATIRNCHTVFLSGLGPSSDSMDILFKAAKKNLFKMPLIGVVDRYDESMVVFEEYLKKYFSNIDLSYVRLNVTDKNQELSIDDKANEILKILDDDIQQLVLEKNTYDMELYRLSHKLLNEKILITKNFSDKLSNFIERCEDLNAN